MFTGNFSFLLTQYQALRDHCLQSAYHLYRETRTPYVMTDEPNKVVYNSTVTGRKKGLIDRT